MAKSEGFHLMAHMCTYYTLYYILYLSTIYILSTHIHIVPVWRSRRGSTWWLPALGRCGWGGAGPRSRPCVRVCVSMYSMYCTIYIMFVYLLYTLLSICIYVISTIYLLYLLVTFNRMYTIDIYYLYSTYIMFIYLSIYISIYLSIYIHTYLLVTFSLASSRTRSPAPKGEMPCSAADCTYSVCSA
jgi:hypothetical protein